MSNARDGSGHRWSGWPGAYCLYCGMEDIREVCLADGHDLDCTDCKQPTCPIADPRKDLIDQAPFGPPKP